MSIIEANSRFRCARIEQPSLPRLTIYIFLTMVGFLLNSCTTGAHAHAQASSYQMIYVPTNNGIQTMPVYIGENKKDDDDRQENESERNRLNIPLENFSYQKLADVSSKITSGTLRLFDRGNGGQVSAPSLINPCTYLESKKLIAVKYLDDILPSYRSTCYFNIYKNHHGDVFYTVNYTDERFSGWQPVKIGSTVYMNPPYSFGYSDVFYSGGRRAIKGRFLVEKFFVGPGENFNLIIGQICQKDPARTSRDKVERGEVKILQQFRLNCN